MERNELKKKKEGAIQLLRASILMLMLMLFFQDLRREKTPLDVCMCYKEFD